MTPGVRAVKKAGAHYKLHEYKHDNRSASYGVEAAEKLGVEPSQVYKTLVVSGADGEMFVAVIPVLESLNLKKIAQATGCKKLAMAEKSLVQKRTGYVLGGVSPFGQKKLLPTYLDASAQNLPTIFVSGGKRGLDIELAPADFCQILRAEYADLLA